MRGTGTSPSVLREGMDIRLFVYDDERIENILEHFRCFQQNAPQELPLLKSDFAEG